RRHTRSKRDWSSDVCSSDLKTRVGDISVAALIGGNVNAIIHDNTIIDNRYGLTIAGPNVWAEIKGNLIEDNDTEGQPMLGGSGRSEERRVGKECRRGGVAQQ